MVKIFDTIVIDNDSDQSYLIEADLNGAWSRFKRNGEVSCVEEL